MLMQSLVLAAYVHNPINIKFLDTVLLPFYVIGESLVAFTMRKVISRCNISFGYAKLDNLWLLPFFDLFKVCSMFDWLVAHAS